MEKNDRFQSYISRKSGYIIKVLAHEPDAIANRRPKPRNALGLGTNWHLLHNF